MYKQVIPLLLGAGLSVTTTAWSQTAPDWTLNASVQRAVEVAPEIKTADAEIGIQQGKQQEADAWPNPTVSMQVDDKLGIDDGRGGYDVTELAISQPLPFGRLGNQRKQAQAALASATSMRSQQQLLLEYQVAHRFHMLQLAQAKLDLAKQRLQEAERYQRSHRKQANGDQLVRYLTPLESMRMDIVLQTAKQSMDMAEGEFTEAAASFKSLLNLPFESTVQVPALSTVMAPHDFALLEKALGNHPLLTADKQSVAAADAGIAVAKSKRFNDPTLTLFRQKDYLANRRDDVTGVMLSVQIPLWNNNKGQVTQARYMLQQAQAELELKQRQLSINLHKNYLHLGHLIEQAEHYRTKLLQPASNVLKLTRRGFESGSLNILNLIDANNTYFDTQLRYYELLEESWLELAELRKSAGLSLQNTQSVLQSGEVK